MFDLSLQSFIFSIGLFVTSYYTFRFVFLLVDIVRPGKSLNSYAAGKGGWAVVTGATDGIGKAMCIEMAKKKMNLVLVSRNQEKLSGLKQELEQLGTKVQTVAIDLAKATTKDWESVKKVVDSVNATVLVNCAGLSHEYPKPFEKEELERCEDILEVNVNALTKMTRLVIPQMKTRRNGLILNVGSFVSTVPSPYLAMYSGSKSFVQVFSQALGAELVNYGVLVQYVNTFYVVSKMSKIRKANFTTPTATSYAKGILSHIGSGCGSAQPYTTVPYFSHALINYIVETYMSRKFWLDLSRGHLEDIRKRALAKQAKLEKLANKNQ